jgi:catalase (peroxidase I)
LSNEFFTRLANFDAMYTAVNVTDPRGKVNTQFVDARGLMMLPSDVTLWRDAGFKPIVQQYAANSATFLRDFQNAIQKLFQLGLDPNMLGVPVNTVLNNRNVPARPAPAQNRPVNSNPWSPYYTNTMSQMDWQNLRQDISYLVQAGNGPLLIRLAWVNIIYALL